MNNKFAKYLLFVTLWTFAVDYELCLGLNNTQRPGINSTKSQGINSTKWQGISSAKRQGNNSTKPSVRIFTEMNNGDILQFWYRDPRFDTTKKQIDIRRRAENKINRFKPIYNKKNRYYQGQLLRMRNKYRYDRFNSSQLIKPTNNGVNERYDQSQPSYPINIKKDLVQYVQPKPNRTAKQSYRYTQNRIQVNTNSDGESRNMRRKPDAAEALNFRTIKEKSGVPLRNDHFVRGKHKSRESKSTRMIPMVLMQREEETTKKWDDDPSYKWYLDRFIINPYTLIDQFDKLLSEFFKVQVTKEILGRTAEYNNILLLKMTERRDSFFRASEDRYIHNDRKEKKIIFIVHALTAIGLNNLFSLTIETYLRHLLSYYLAHIETFDIYLMPLANPDGYLQNRNINYWIKNFSPQAECNGVALDRNFDVAWNFSANEMSSCHPHYPGPKPFSEAESSAVRDVFHKYSHNIVGYFHVHAGTYDDKTFKGDAVLYPKGFTEVQTDDDRYVDLRGDIDEAIKNADFRILSVTVDSLYNWYGKISGSSVDYAAAVYGIPYSLELVMQSYQDPFDVNYHRVLTGIHQELELDALTQIWSRVIEVIFLNIRDKMEAKDD